MPVTCLLCVCAFIIFYHNVSATGLKHNEECEESVQCNYSDEMECRDNKCQCKTNFIYDGTQCLGSLGLGQECERDVECLDSSDLKQRTVWCYSRQCTCRSGFKREGARCVIGGDCTQNSDCAQLENSICNMKMRNRYQCMCQDNYLAAANNTKCLPIARYSEMCEESRQCTYSKEAECQDSKCQCSTNTEYKEGQCVLRTVGVGASCTKNDDCKLVNNAVCKGGVCTCITGLVPDAGNTRCLPKVGYNVPCSETAQCEDLGEATCDTVCKCKSNFNYNGKICAGNTGLGDPCEADNQCFVPNDLKLDTVWCHGSQCSCKDGYKRDGDRCVIGGDCTTNNDCKYLGNSFCDQRVRDRYHCACQLNFISVGNNTKCFPIATGIGGGCEYDEQCSKKLGNAVCTNNQCKCAAGVNPNDGNTCGIPGVCSTDKDCSQLENAYCSNYKCKCKDGFMLVGNNTKCFPVATDIGSGCEYDEQCSQKLGEAVCTNYKCKCAAGAILNNDNTCGAAVRIVLSLSCFVLVLMVKLL